MFWTALAQLDLRDSKPICATTLLFYSHNPASSLLMDSGQSNISWMINGIIQPSNHSPPVPSCPTRLQLPVVSRCSTFHFVKIQVQLSREHQGFTVYVQQGWKGGSPIQRGPPGRTQQDPTGQLELHRTDDLCLSLLALRVWKEMAACPPSPAADLFILFLTR